MWFDGVGDGGCVQFFGYQCHDPNQLLQDHIRAWQERAHVLQRYIALVKYSNGRFYGTYCARLVLVIYVGKPPAKHCKQCATEVLVGTPPRAKIILSCAILASDMFSGPSSLKVWVALRGQLKATPTRNHSLFASASHHGKGFDMELPRANYLSQDKFTSHLVERALSTTTAMAIPANTFTALITTAQSSQQHPTLSTKFRACPPWISLPPAARIHP
jgi:hypothetical protein